MDFEYIQIDGFGSSLSSYGPPSGSYGPPSSSYGPPAASSRVVGKYTPAENFLF